MAEHAAPSNVIPAERIARSIVVIRGRKVMLGRLRSQIVTSNPRGGYPPYAFTEQGVVMLSGVLNSPRAIEERRYDAQFKIAFDAIRELIAPPRRTARRVGFRAGDETTR
jgi:hypothetical protein